MQQRYHGPVWPTTAVDFTRVHAEVDDGETLIKGCVGRAVGAQSIKLRVRPAERVDVAVPKHAAVGVDGGVMARDVCEIY